MKEKLSYYLLIIATIPIAGEFRLFPLENEFRVSLSTPLFLFYLLWLKKIHPIFSGVLAGVSVVLFRTWLSITFGDDTTFSQAFLTHAPVFFYYFIYGTIFNFCKVNNYYSRPIIIGLLSTSTEAISSFLEIFLRFLICSQETRMLTISMIIPIAFIRSFFVLGFFYALILKKIKIFDDVQRKRNEQMMILVSNLYVEMINLKKSMKDAEVLTHDCYELYRKLSKEESSTSKDALKIAGKIHDIKKGHQQIYFGLRKLMVKEKLVNKMSMYEIVDIVSKTNINYSEGLHKKIKFSTSISGVHPNYPSYLLLSILNNLVSNAVEAIKLEGTIQIDVKAENNILQIKVSDNGSGISKRHAPFIFQPGFTTKFDEEGYASNGIGLPYIKRVIEDLEGTIDLQTTEPHTITTFLISLPIKNLTQSEDTS